MKLLLRPLPIICILFTLVWLCGFVWFISLIPTEPTDDSQHTDAIVVLTGGSLRLDHGFQLLIEHKADKMFISGVEEWVSLQSLLHEKEYASYATQVPPGSIALGHRARSTLQNAEETAQWVAQEHVQSIRLVTGNYHMPRSMYELGRVLPYVKLVPDPVFPNAFEHGQWWTSINGIRLVVSEYHKYVASLIGHRLLAQS